MLILKFEQERGKLEEKTFSEEKALIENLQLRGKNAFIKKSMTGCSLGKTQPNKGGVQKYFLCNLVDFSIKWWVGSCKSIKLITNLVNFIH